MTRISVFAALSTTLAAGALLLPSTAPAAATRERPVLGYVDRLPAETPAQRGERHQRIAERRKGPAIIVHRGAAAIAPENTLEAYAASMDFGADGCEIDLRRTLDGVLVLFHDDMLDHLTEGFGEVRQVTYFELLSLRPRFLYGTASKSTRPPTFAATLDLARRRAMLLMLDVKEEGLDEQLASMIEEADAWDHIIAVNRTTAPKLAADPRVKPLRFKGPGLYESRKDMDPASVKAQIALPGEMIMVDDPRVAARELGRTPYAPVPLPDLRRKWEPLHLSNVPPHGPVAAPAYLRERERLTDPNNREQLLKLIEGGPDAERTLFEGPGEYQIRRTERILDRAWAATRLARLKRPQDPFTEWLNRSDRRRVIEVLTKQVRQRSLDKDWIYHGLDGAMAIRALGDLGASETLPILREAFFRVDPALKAVENPNFGPNPLSWTDFRVKMAIMPAVGRFRTPETKAFLLEFLALSPAQRRELTPEGVEEATRSLFRQELSQTEIETLLKSPDLGVRGTALSECLDRPSKARTAALKAAIPWAEPLPSGVSR